MQFVEIFQFTKGSTTKFNIANEKKNIKFCP